MLQIQSRLHTASFVTNIVDTSLVSLEHISYLILLILVLVSDYAEDERELQMAQISGLNPNVHVAQEPDLGAVSPPVILASATTEGELNPYEEALPDVDEDFEEDSDEDSDYDYNNDQEPVAHFAVLHTSLPGHIEIGRAHV